MRPSTLPDALRLTLSLLLGGVITLGLFSLIAQLSLRHPVHDPVQEVLVVDLLAWESPAVSRPKPVTSPPPRPNPVRAVPPKRIAQTPPIEPPDKRSGKPPDAPQPPAPAPQPAPEPPPSASSVKSATTELPDPVPLFKLTQAPRFLHKVTPVYPEAKRALGQGAVVRLKALVDAQGRVRKVVILESAGARFDEAARAAILASSFAPARIGQRRVAVWLSLPVRFRLR